MKITEIKIKKNRYKSRVLAFCDITFNDKLVIHGVKIINGEHSLHVSFPSNKLPTGEFKDIVHPIRQEVRESMTKDILEHYSNFKKGA